MHNPAVFLENDTHKLLRDFGIETDHLISTRRPDLIIINNKNKMRICKIVDFAVPADYRIKLKESENKISTSTLLGNLKKENREHEGDDYTNREWCIRYSN